MTYREMRKKLFEAFDHVDLLSLDSEMAEEDTAQLIEIINQK